MQQKNYNSFEVSFMWNKLSFSCRASLTDLNLDYNLSHARGSSRELLRLYELLLSKDDIAIADLAFHTRYLQHLYAVLLYKHLQHILVGIRLVDVYLVDADIIDNHHVILDLDADLVWLNQVMLIAQSEQALASILLQYQVLRFAPVIPQVAPMQGQFALAIANNKYNIQVQPYLYEVASTLQHIYLKVELRVAHKDIIIYLTTNIIYHLAQKILDKKLPLNDAQFFAQMVLNIIISQLKSNVVLIDYSYTQISTGNYIQFNALDLTQPGEGIILLAVEQFADVAELITNLFQADDSQADLCIDDSLPLSFPIELTHFKLTTDQINQLQLGDVVIINEIMPNEIEDILQCGVINLGLSSLPIKFISENQIIITDNKVN